MVEIGLSIPLIDWGKRRGQVKVAESNRQVTESRLRQETMNFNQDLFILVERFCNQQQQLAIADKASEIAQRRYDTNVATFMIGRISTLDLNDSQVKKDQSARPTSTNFTATGITTISCGRSRCGTTRALRASTPT